MEYPQACREKALQSPENYFRWRVSRAKDFLQLTKEYLSLRDKSVLDFGCGEGSLSYLLCEKGAKVFAIDVSEKYLKALKKNLKNLPIDARTAGGEKLPFKNDSFEAIFNFDVLEHVQNIKKAFSEMKRCLKKGGYIFLEMTPYWSFATGHHLYDFTHLPVQYLPKNLIKNWIFRKKSNPIDTPQTAWQQFCNLNKITISQIRGQAEKNKLKILEENFIFKIPPIFETKINWIKYFGPLKETIPMSYQAVLKKG